MVRAIKVIKHPRVEELEHLNFLFDKRGLVLTKFLQVDDHLVLLV